MATYTWSNPNGGSFADPANWSPNGTPGADDSAFFNLGGEIAYTVSGDGTAGYILVYDTVTFTGTIDADVLSGNFTALQVGEGGSAIFDGGSLDSTGEARIGDNAGSGQLIFENGATGTLTASNTANALDVAFADQAGTSTTGTVAVDGAGSALTLLGGAYIGTDGAGTLTVSESASVQLDAYAAAFTSFEVGEGAGANGLVDVTSGGTLSIGEYTVVGDAGAGTMDFSDGAIGDFNGTFYSGSAFDESYALYLGGAGGTGAVSVDGAGTDVTADDGLLIGQYGQGTLSVTNGATFTIDTNQSDAFGYSFVGSGSTAHGTLIVSGAAVFNDNSVLAISDAGQGTIEISSGGTVISDALTGDVSGELGAAAGGTGTGTIDDGLWDAKQSFAVGYQGDGTLTVQDGGTLEVDGAFLRIARDPGSSGALTVDSATVIAPNAVLTVGPDATNAGDGTGGTGVLDIEDGSTVNVASGLIAGLAGGTGSVDVNNASLSFSGSVSTGAGTGIITAENNGGISVGGSIVIGGGGGAASVTITNFGGLYDQGGGVTLSALGTLALDGTAYLDTANGATTAPLVLDGGTLSVLGDGALRAPLTIDVAGGTTAGPSAIIGENAGDLVIAGINFTGTGGSTLLLGPGFDSGNAINGFSTGDTLDIRIDSGLVYDNATYDTGTDTLTLSDGDGHTLALHVIDDGYTANSFGTVADGAGGTDVALGLCYLRGTRVLAPTGEMLVEQLTIGDRLVTRFGGIRTIKWIGRQSYDWRFLQKNLALRPVRIRAGALGDAMPLRDLLVSGGHSVLCGGTLVLARALVNGITIGYEPVPEDAAGAAPVDYFQIDFLEHDCIVAEGIFAETFADGPGLRRQFHNAAEFAALYPHHPAPQELRLAAPRPERGPALAAAIAPIVNRASDGVVRGPLEGFVDLVRCDLIEGWALDTHQPLLPVALELFADGEMIGTALACDERHDLRDAGKGDGRCAFSFVPAIALDTAVAVTVRRAVDGAVLGFTGSALRKVA